MSHSALNRLALFGTRRLYVLAIGTERSPTEPEDAMNNTLGTVTTYHGNEHRYLRGHQVRIVAVIKNAARDDYDPDADDGYLTDEQDIVRRGGITADDRVEVQP
jgi:hypothetical protein